jgi:hypothetical protein
LLAEGLIPDVPSAKLKPGPLLGSHRSSDLFQVARVAGGEIVQATHGLVAFQKGLEQVGPDETSHTGDQPSGRVPLDHRFKIFRQTHVDCTVLGLSQDVNPIGLGLAIVAAKVIAKAVSRVKPFPVAKCLGTWAGPCSMNL